MRARVVVFWAVVGVLGLPALLLTFTRLVEPYGELWIQVEAFTPLGLLLYAVVLAALVARLLAVRRWWSVTSVAAVVALGCLGLHGWWYAPQVTGANPPPARDATPLVVMTANLQFGGADGVEVVRRASAAEVGLLVVQEITPAVLADMDRAGLADLLPHRIGVPGGGARGTMAFARGELSGSMPLSTTNDSWSFRLDDLTVIAVHAAWPPDTSRWYADHHAIARATDRLEPDLVVGDFNATDDHAPMRALADAGYRDAGELANEGWQATWPTSGLFDVVGVPLAQIDHVLVGGSLAALSTRTVGVPGSDHRAVLATVAPR
ncbi:endonuclease/exonuclease/phosphatase family protein [Nocardioides sp. LMS-CY]|uniref:endonuclease/exonuclease/phosphatase family protein n=1 Tax=Nocardioides sp. (strain LMS-CY) TaxID=2840457 RepID=UPI001BFFE047|nr:endonuclease/exonuclease/phosphatase family protein [Nocardioides sp. LMS-CY]QWF20941.1 endonuclease/exonuclease/phosphatase family protein [Nocardioides sp. LMS-CY]